MKGQLIKVAELGLVIDNSIPLSSNYEPFKVNTPDNCPIISAISLGDIFLSPNMHYNEKSNLDENEELMISQNNNGNYNATIKVLSTGKVYFLQASSRWDYITLSRNCTTSYHSCTS